MKRPPGEGPVPSLGGEKQHIQFIGKSNMKNVVLEEDMLNLKWKAAWRGSSTYSGRWRARLSTYWWIEYEGCSFEWRDAKFKVERLPEEGTVPTLGSEERHFQIIGKLNKSIRYCFERRDAKFKVERPPGEGPVPSLGGEERRIQIWRMLFKTIRRDAKFKVERPPGEGPVPSLGGEEILTPRIGWCIQIWRILFRIITRDAKFAVERSPGEGPVPSFVGEEKTTNAINRWVQSNLYTSST